MAIVFTLKICLLFEKKVLFRIIPNWIKFTPTVAMSGALLKQRFCYKMVVNVDKGPRVKIDEINFEGNEIYKTKKLQNKLNGECDKDLWLIQDHF